MGAQGGIGAGAVPVPVQAGRMVSQALTLLLGLVVMSSLITVLATFQAHEEFPVFDGFLKATNIVTLLFEVTFIVAAGLVVGARVWGGRGMAWPSARERAVYGLFLVYVVAAIALRWQGLPRIESAMWVVHLMFFFSLRALWGAGVTVDFRFVWAAFGAAALVHIGLFVVFLLQLPDPQAFEWKGRIPGFTNIRHLAYFAAPAATLLAGMVLVGPKKYVPLGAVSLAIVLVYPSWTGGRGSFLAFLVATLTLLAFRRARKPGRMLIVALAIVFALLLPLVLPQVGPWPPILDRLGQIGQDDVTLNQLSTGRLRIWSIVAGAIGDAPVFGHGPVQVTGVLAAAGVEYSLTNPHNIVLQILLHWGGVGLALVLAFIGVHARQIAGAVSAGSPDAILAFGVLLTFLVHGQIDGTLYYPFTFLIAVLAFFRLWMLGAAKAGAGAETDARR